MGTKRAIVGGELKHSSVIHLENIIGWEGFLWLYAQKISTPGWVVSFGCWGFPLFPGVFFSAERLIRATFSSVLFFLSFFLSLFFTYPKQHVFGERLSRGSLQVTFPSGIFLSCFLSFFLS